MRPDDNEQALTLLHKAIELDPNYAPALAFLAWGYEQRLVRDWGAYGEDDAGIAVALAPAASQRCEAAQQAVYMPDGTGCALMAYSVHLFQDASQ